MPRRRARESLVVAAHISREDHLATVIRQALTCTPDPAAVLRRATL